MDWGVGRRLVKVKKSCVCVCVCFCVYVCVSASMYMPNDIATSELKMHTLSKE